MGLLDGGLQAIFGAAFAPIYLSGMLHRIAKDGDGAIIKPVSWTDVAIKGQRDDYTDLQRADWNIPQKAVRLIVLQAGVPAEPTADDEITLAGRRWRISNISRDPAAAAWVMMGVPAS